MAKFKDKLERWVDETKLAFVGTGMVLRQPKYLAITLIGFLFFVFILTLFKDGTSTWSLLWSRIAFTDKLGLLGNVWLRALHNFTDLWGIMIILMSALQGLTIALLIYGWRMKVASKTTTAGLEAGGVGTAIGFLALGCPTCGTTLLAPFLTMLLGSGAAAVADTLGWVFVILALILLLYAARRLGYGAYIETTARRYQKNGKN